MNVAGTAYDFRHLTPIGQNLRNTNLPDGFTAPAGQLKQLQIAHGYDNNWVLNGSGYRQVSTALDPKTGIVLRTFTDQPGVQFYSSNFQVGDLIGTSGKRVPPDPGIHPGDPALPGLAAPHRRPGMAVRGPQRGRNVHLEHGVRVLGRRWSRPPLGATPH